MSSLLKQRQALAKLRWELEGREEHRCWNCRLFGHLAKNCRNKGGKEKEKMKKMSNRFEALTTRVMQCGVKEVRQQEVVEERRQCFQCREEGHKKWECPKGNKKRREEAAPLREVWRKIREHCGAKELPPRGAVMSIEGWMMKWKVVTLVECRRYDYKGTKTQEN